MDHYGDGLLDRAGLLGQEGGGVDRRQKGWPTARLACQALACVAGGHQTCGYTPRQLGRLLPARDICEEPEEAVVRSRATTPGDETLTEGAKAARARPSTLPAAGGTLKAPSWTQPGTDAKVT